jgi:thiamine biosynthesis lipoprotein ApbE
MLADALATAAFVLGPEHGIALLERMGVEGLLITPQLERFRTAGFGRA